MTEPQEPRCTGSGIIVRDGRTSSWSSYTTPDGGHTRMTSPDGSESVLYWIRDDGGRAAAGFRGETGDCGVRAAAIASARPYREVYDAINLLARGERPRKGRKRSSAREGVHARTLTRFMEAQGFAWTPTMGVGTGCTMHLRPDELPSGRLVVRASKHYVALIDGVIHDLYDPSRGGTRCVYGYWRRA